jgi:hypothetical protein
VLSVGLDLHKKYSQFEVFEQSGERRAAARLANECRSNVTSQRRRATTRDGHADVEPPIGFAE